MPFKSEKQRKYMFANHPEIAKRWTYEYKNSGGCVDSARLNRLRRWMDDPKLSERDRALIAEAIGIVKCPKTGQYKYGGGEVYKQEGGNIARAVVDNALGLGGSGNVRDAVIENAFPSETAALNQKVAQARAAGVPESEISKVLKNNALKTRNAQQRAALMQAAGAARDATSRDQAGLITQAGLQNQAYTPRGGAGAAIGAGLAGASQAEARYQQELSQIDRDEEQKRIDALDKEKEADDSAGKNKAIKLATEAMSLVADASTAGDYVNGFTTFSDEEERSIGEKVTGFLGGLAQTAAGAFEQSRRVREEARERLVAAKYPDSYRAYTRLRNLANQMVFPILESGALGVNPTDADVDLARKATFDVNSPSNTWAAQLNDIIVKNGGAALETPKPTKWGGAEVQEEEPAVAEVEAEAAVEAAVESSVPPHGGAGADSGQDLAKLTIKEESALYKTLNSRVPKSVKLKAVQAWMKLNKLNPDSIITYKGKTGPLRDLLTLLGWEE